MSPVPDTIFDLLLNALLQITFFAALAAVFSPLVAKARAKQQHLFYVTALLFCLAAPLFNTCCQPDSTAAADRSQQQLAPDAGGVYPGGFWIWQEHSGKHRHFTIASEAEGWIVSVWGALVLLRLARFSRAAHRVHRLRRRASSLAPAQVAMASRIIGPRHRIAFLESADIDDPVTVGLFHPAILLPTKLLPDLDEQAFFAVLAHEHGHIRRRDFPVHMVCELISLPVAWHPGVRYLMSRISQTREIAGDEYAAVLLGKRRSYADALVHLASLCLHVRRATAAGLGIFDGDNLETRIMMLTRKSRSLSQAGLVGLTVATSLTFCAGAVLAHAMSLQANSAPSNIAEKFAGTWHWMFDGRSFSTMTLVRSGSGFTGSVTPSEIALNDEGELSRADPSEDSRPKPIAKATLEGSALHVTVQDGNEPFEFILTLKDDTHAEIHPVGAPPNMKPIPAEKVH